MRLYALELTTQREDAPQLLATLKDKSRDYVAKHSQDPHVAGHADGDVDLWSVSGTLEKFRDKLTIQTARQESHVSWRVDLESTTSDLRPRNWVPKHLTIVNDIIALAEWTNKTGEVRDDARRLPSHLCPDFAQVLLKPSRQTPIIVVTPHNDLDAHLIDADQLAYVLGGLAHVYIIEERQATFSLTNSLPNRMGVFDGGVRIYWPGLSLRSDPQDHHLFTGAQLLDMAEGEGEDAVRAPTSKACTTSSRPSTTT